MRGLYVCLLVWLLPGSSTQDKTTCRVRPVRLTEDTSLTCFFPQDLSVSKKDFTVYHYLDGKRPVSVLDCLWLSGRLECFTASSYEYNRLVSNRVTVRIPSVTLNHTGKYSCQISGSNPNDLEFCRLFLTSGKTSCQVAEADPTTDTNLTCYFPEDISRSQRDFAVYRFKDQETSELVVDCSWTAGEMKCNAQGGNQVDPKISDHVTVSIRQVSQEHTGTYLCGLVGDGPDTSLACSLHLKHLDNVLPEKAQEAGHNTEAFTAVIIVLAIATSALLLWVVLRECLWHRLRCSQTTQESHEEENYKTRMKTRDVTSRAHGKQDFALTCPTGVLAWCRRLRRKDPRNQVEEIGETDNPLLWNLSYNQCALENNSNRDEIFPRTWRSDQTEIGQGGSREPDLSSFKQPPAIVLQSLMSESVVAAVVADEDTGDEISNDRTGESVDKSARTKTMEKRSQPEEVSVAEGEQCSAVINTDTGQEEGKQGAQSAGGTAPSPPEETQPSTPLDASGENQPRDVKTETMGTLEEATLHMNPISVDHRPEMSEKENGKDKKRPSSKKKITKSYKDNNKNRTKCEEPIRDSEEHDSDTALNDKLARERAGHVSPSKTKTKKSTSWRSKSKDKTETTDVKDGDKMLSKLRKSLKGGKTAQEEPDCPHNI